MRVARCVLGLLAVVFFTAAPAQPYPAKPVKLFVPFPPGGSFDPISQLVQAPGILLAHPSLPASSFTDFVAYLRTNPGKVSVGMVGAGSSGNLTAVLLMQLTDAQVTFVNYRGDGPLTNDILGGHVNVVFGTSALWEPHVRSGKLKALAVLGKSRAAQYPDLPAANEIVPGVESRTWFGLLGPAGLPKGVLANIHRETVRALNDLKLKENLVNRRSSAVRPRLVPNSSGGSPRRAVG